MKTREQARPQYVFIIDLAAYLGRTGTAIRVKAARMGITPIAIRRDVSGKAALAVTADEAKRLVAADVARVETVSPAELMGAVRP